jgi:hypothetical protein
MLTMVESAPRGLRENKTNRHGQIDEIAASLN